MSLSYRKYENRISLFKYCWCIKDKVSRSLQIKWSIVKYSNAYFGNGSHCNVCHEENYRYLFEDAGCPGYDTKSHLMVRLHSWSLDYGEYSFITISLSSSLTQIVVQVRVSSIDQIELFNHFLRIIMISYLKR